MTMDQKARMAMSDLDDRNNCCGVEGAPNEAALLRLMERTGFSMIQENGQRKYGGPPPGWEGPPPVKGCEIFVGKIPRDIFEDELVPIFEKVGKLYEMRLMMDFSGSNRGYAFVMYTNRNDALRAVKEMNNYRIRDERYLGVCMSVDNCRLFVGGIPKSVCKEEIMHEMEKVTDGVVDVIVYPSAADKTKNRGFAFVEYSSHRAAAMARRKLIPGKIQLFNHQIAVDWAEPEREVEDDVMDKVGNLLNLGYSYFSLLNPRYCHCFNAHASDVCTNISRHSFRPALLIVSSALKLKGFARRPKTANSNRSSSTLRGI